MSLSDRLDAYRRPAAGAFVLFHLVVILVWNGVPGGPLGRELHDAIAPYVRFTGLWQGWALFAPRPIMADVVVEARLRHRDGTRTVWRFPRASEAGTFARVRMERHRTWTESLPDANYADAWPSTARWIARQVSRPDNPVEVVELVRIPTPLPPAPGETAPRPRKAREARFFVTVIDGEDLR